jgi:hypothetical protein
LLITLTAPLNGQVYKDPPTSQTFADAIQPLTVLRSYTFGTAVGRSVRSLQDLAKSFSPYGIAGTIVINREWQRYQPFNAANFVFTPSTLNLTATIPADGGLFAGGIHSGQIWTMQTFQPGTNGHVVLAFEVRMRIPPGRGMWPAAWLFAKTPGLGDTSEIDNPEFFNMQTQNEFDWTSNLHGPGVGRETYSIKTNQWVWHPGINFSSGFHDYQTLWTQDMEYSYLDGKLIHAQEFKWTAKGEAQFGINLAVGSSNTDSLPGLQPTSLGEFPAALQIDHFTIWAK